MPRTSSYRVGRCAPFVVAATLALASAVTAIACNVPVFRFALEHWRPDAYRVTLFHREPLSAAEREQLAAIEKLEEAAQGNVAVQAVNLADELPEVEQRLFESLGATELSRLVVQYPKQTGIEIPVWSGPLSGESIKELLHSPARRELIKRLAAGQTAVWLLLESGDSEKDGAAEQLLTEELAKLTQNLELPELTAAPADKLLTTMPLDVQFSLLHVPREEIETFLVQSLLRSEPDLMERLEPMVFPVFGRGRALLPLIGAGITPENIQGAAEFLTGACSCEVKSLNPGFDLLLVADWENLLMLRGEAEVVKRYSRESTEYVPIPTGSAGTRDQLRSMRRESSARPNESQITLVSAFGAAIAIAAALAAVLSLQKP